MAGEYTDGYVFGATETVTTGKLQDQFLLGTLQNVARTHFGTSTRPITNNSSLATASLIGGELAYLNTVHEFHGYNSGETEWSVFPQVRRLTNKSGGGVVRGDVIVIDTTTAKSFMTTTTAAQAGIIGVALDTIASNAVGPVQFYGYVPVNVTGATAIGDFLQTSATAKKADPSVTIPATTGNSFARAVTTSAAQVMAFLFGATVSDFGSVATSISKEFDPRQRLYVGDDFVSLSAALAATADGIVNSEHAYYGDTNAASSGIDLSTAAGNHGAIRITRAELHLAKNATGGQSVPFQATKTAFSLKLRFTSESPGSGTHYVGLGDGTAFPQNNGVYCKVTGNTGNIIAVVVQGGGAEATLDTGVATAAGVYHDVQFKRTGATTMDVYVDGTLKGTITSTIPTAQIGFVARSEIASAIDVTIDYWQVSYDR